MNFPEAKEVMENKEKKQLYRLYKFFGLFPGTRNNGSRFFYSSKDQGQFKGFGFHRRFFQFLNSNIIG
jgi:hypothetical protein